MPQWARTHRPTGKMAHSNRPRITLVTSFVRVQRRCTTHVDPHCAGRNSMFSNQLDGHTRMCALARCANGHYMQPSCGIMRRTPGQSEHSAVAATTSTTRHNVRQQQSGCELCGWGKRSTQHAANRDHHQNVFPLWGRPTQCKLRSIGFPHEQLRKRYVGFLRQVPPHGATPTFDIPAPGGDPSLSNPAWPQHTNDNNAATCNRVAGGIKQNALCAPNTISKHKYAQLEHNGCV